MGMKNALATREGTTAPPITVATRRRAESLHCGEYAAGLADHLGEEQHDEDEQRGDERRHRDEQPGAGEVERSQQTERQRARPPDEQVILADGPREHHADHIRGRHRLAPRPECQASEPEQDEKNVLRYQLRNSASIPGEETWRLRQ